MSPSRHFLTSPFETEEQVRKVRTPGAPHTPSSLPHLLLLRGGEEVRVRAAQPTSKRGGEVRKSDPENAQAGQGTERDKINSVPPLGAATGRPAARFRDLDEAALFDERAAIREHDAGLSREAAERLAWLDVLAARQVAAGALASLTDAPVFSGGAVARNQSGKVATKEFRS